MSQRLSVKDLKRQAFIMMWQIFSKRPVSSRCTSLTSYLALFHMICRSAQSSAMLGSNPKVTQKLNSGFWASSLAGTNCSDPAMKAGREP